MTMTPEQLKRIRGRMNMTQKQLAGALGVWQETVARWEIGSRRIPEPMARLLKFIDKITGSIVAARRDRATTQLFLEFFHAGQLGGKDQGERAKKRHKKRST